MMLFWAPHFKCAIDAILLTGGSRANIAHLMLKPKDVSNRDGVHKYNSLLPRTKCQKTPSIESNMQHAAFLNGEKKREKGWGGRYLSYFLALAASTVPNSLTQCMPLHKELEGAMNGGIVRISSTDQMLSIMHTCVEGHANALQLFMHYEYFKHVPVLECWS
eukprot:scaffold15392_cov19-Prasinocladus_malaysianus.AAC.1